VQRDSDEDAWRAIVENYGERAELDDEPLADPPPEQKLERFFVPLPQPDVEEVDDEPEDRFVPPTPPPLPKLPPDRLLAWLGLFGSPSVLLICVVLNVHLPPWIGYLLVASFIGGFLYLVLKMPRRDDIDPWDDGARI
jgi:hypothetical protein